MPTTDDDLLVFAAEEDAPAAQPAAAPEAATWRVLVVDDDAFVHKVTEMALQGVQLDGKRLHLDHAYSGVEAKVLLQQHADTAVVLLDVVMETGDAGLQLLRWLRGEHHNHLTRVVLRTGQPGDAPEREVMLRDDINDYQPKSELSARRLVTAVLRALEGWRDLSALAKERDCALLLLDIRGFESLAARLESQRTFALVNKLFEHIVPEIHAEHGIIDKYLGSGFLALFPTQPDAAVRAANRVLERVEALGRCGPDEGGLSEPVQLNIGIHWGPSLPGGVATDGAPQVREGVDSLSVGAQLERLTRQFDARLLVSGALVQRLSPETARSAQAHYTLAEVREQNL